MSVSGPRMCVSGPRMSTVTARCPDHPLTGAFTGRVV